VKRVWAGAAAIYWARAGWAHAHGSDEIEIFQYLLEEPGFFRMTALILGALIFLLGVFITNQGWRESQRLRAESDESSSSSEQPMTIFQLTLPGALFAAVGAAIIFAAVFILPDKIETKPHAHPADKEMKTEPPGSANTQSSR